jgi:hypothetical protein
MRADLISAISACAEARLRRRSRRFLQGLSTDELQYIAEFLGARILECAERAANRPELADRIARFERERPAALASRDRDHKMILLLEYLCRCRNYSAASFSSRIQMLR